MDALHTLVRLGGIAHLTELEGNGVPRRDLRRLITSGDLIRPRRAWYAVPNADPVLIRAISHGGIVTCVSALKRLGVWCVDDHRLHVAVPAKSGHVSAAGAGLRVHYARSAAPTSGPPAASIIEAIVDQFGCQTGENIVVTLDSALNMHLIRMTDLHDIRSRIPQKYWPLLECVDGKCESGLETKVRLRLGRRGLRYRTQVYIPGVGAVDILIGDRLIVETDGLEFHTGHAAVKDRERDLMLHRMGYIVIRVTYAMVMYRWDEVESAIDAYVSRREHLWAPRHFRAGLAR